MTSFDYDIQKLMSLAKPIPRFTSYPTAVEWNDVSPQTYEQHLHLLSKKTDPVSIYTHVPFCKSMCLYCGCPVVLNRRQENEERYVRSLCQEIEKVAGYFPEKKTISELHFGGGTPTKLTEELLAEIMDTYRSCFLFDGSQEISIEIDPRTVVEDQGKKLRFLKSIGFNRVSFGVQDTSEIVQEAIKRRQSREMTLTTFDWAREIAFEGGINIDLIYGLPYQTVDSFRQTIQDIITMSPDRIALFSFAYVPWIKSHQKALDVATLPSVREKFEIYLMAKQSLEEAGYLSIGMDHFARHNDELAVCFKEKKLKRNFMGYTTCPTQDLLAFGYFSIGYVQGGYFQNAKELPDYYKALDQGILPTVKGKILSQDDLVRKWVIEQLMCQFEVDKLLFAQTFGIKFEDYFKEELPLIIELENEDLVVHNQRFLKATDYGHLFIRNVAVVFDRYFQTQAKQKQSQQFSMSV